MARDSEGRLKTDVFHEDNTEIHLIVKFVSGRDDAILNVELEHADDEIRFAEGEYAPGAGETKFDLKLQRHFILDGKEQIDEDGPWPPGPYSVTLLVDGEIHRTVSFSVLDDAPPPDGGTEDADVEEPGASN